MLQKGLIVSIQGYTKETTEELAKDAANAGAVAIRTDKEIECRLPLIGLSKKRRVDIRTEPYITSDIESVKKVSKWADYVAIDYRTLNKNIDAISEYTHDKRIKVLADIETIEDYENLVDQCYHYDYVTTTFTVFHSRYEPDLEIIKKIVYTNSEEDIIAEGNFHKMKDVVDAFEAGAKNVCIGSAIANIFKLTKKYVSCYDIYRRH